MIFKFRKKLKFWNFIKNTFLDLDNFFYNQYFSIIQFIIINFNIIYKTLIFINIFITIFINIIYNIKKRFAVI